MIDRIKKKWGIENSFQFIVILIVFAVTGSASAGVSGTIADYFELDNLHDLLYWPIPVSYTHLTLPTILLV